MYNALKGGPGARQQHGIRTKSLYVLIQIIRLVQGVNLSKLSWPNYGVS